MLDTPVFLFSVVAERARVKPGLLRQWVARDQPFPWLKNSKKWATRLVSPRDAIAVAITARLVEYGLALRQAAGMARSITINLDEWGGETFVIIRGDSLVKVTAGRKALVEYMADHADLAVTVLNCSAIVDDFNRKLEPAWPSLSHPKAFSPSMATS